MANDTINKNNFAKKPFATWYFREHIPIQVPENILLQSVIDTNMQFHGYCLEIGATRTFDVGQKTFENITEMLAN